MNKVVRHMVWAAVVMLTAGCSTHYMLEADALMDEGHVKDAAEQYERAARGGNKEDALEKLVPIYGQLNEHEKQLAVLQELDQLKNIRASFEYQMAEALMALGRYDEAKEVLEHVRSSELESLVAAKLQMIDIIEQRQADSIYYRANPVQIISYDGDVATAAMPRKVGSDLYFVAESPRFTRVGKDSYVDDYTGHRMLDLWKGEVVDSLENEGLVFMDAEPASELNTNFHDGVVSYSEGSSYGVISKTYLSKEPGFFKKFSQPAGEKEIHEVQLFNSRLELDSLGHSSWVTGTRLAFCEEGYMYAHPILSPDGESLYFTSDMPGGEGGMDLWVAEKKGNTWVKPLNLGSTVNTPGDEAFPSMRHADTLFFSSTGHMGLGGLDIVYATGSEGVWTEVHTDLPPPINSSRDDFGVMLDDTGMSGLLSSDRSGADELFKFYSYEPQLELTVEFIHENNKKPWPGIEAELECVSDSTSREFVGNNLGVWKTKVDREKMFAVQCPGALGYSAEYFETPEDQSIQSMTVVVELPMVVILGCMDALAQNYNPDAIVDDGSCVYDYPVFKGCTESHACNYDPEATEDDGSCEYTSCITVEEAEEIIEAVEEEQSLDLHLEWDLDDATIRSADKATIAKFAAYLRANPEVRVLLTSHCDSRATSEYNDILSQRRASAVVAEILSYGIASYRMTSFGASEQFPIHPCANVSDCTEEQHQENRRTIATILSPGEDVIIHHAVKGESVYGIAKKYSVSEQDLVKWNSIGSRGVRAGQDLIIHISR